LKTFTSANGCTPAVENPGTRRNCDAEINAGDNGPSADTVIWGALGGAIFGPPHAPNAHNPTTPIATSRRTVNGR
jgi:hypothetical protein